MDIISLIVTLISGAIGGNLAGSALKDQSLGTMAIQSPAFLGAESAQRFFKPLALPPEREVSTSDL